MRLLGALLITTTLLAPATAHAADVITPSRAVGRTHDCSGYYPTQAWQLGAQGNVLISYDGQADGRLTNVHVIKSSGVLILDQAAVRCVSEHWQNTPATRNGIAIATPGHEAIIQFVIAPPVSNDRPNTHVYASPEARRLLGSPLVTALASLAAIIFATIGATAAVLWLRIRRVCPNCGANNRSAYFFGPTYCSRCGTKFNTPEKPAKTA